ncbi:MAG: inositol monophosphatase family protein [Bacillota bacterium]|nr:inositol monophosphatase family protein [Bacillota bacterium]
MGFICEPFTSPQRGISERDREVIVSRGVLPDPDVVAAHQRWDIENVAAAGTFVLVLPCGNDSHAELGIALAAGARVYILGEPGRPGVFYHGATVCGDEDSLLAALRRDLALAGEARPEGGRDVAVEAGLASRDAVSRVIRGYFPQDPVLDGEGVGGPLPPGRVWLVDPVGGEVNFVSGLPLWSVSVAAAVDGEVVAGAVWVPPGVLYEARAGGLALRGGRWVAPSGVRVLEDAVVSVTVAPGLTAGQARAASECVRRLAPRVRGLRVFCSGALELCWLASGELDACVWPSPVPFGAAAGALVARQAGCDVVDFDGGSCRSGGSRGLLAAATPVLAGALLEVLSGIRWEEQVLDPG